MYINHRESTESNRRSYQEVRLYWVNYEEEEDQENKKDDQKGHQSHPETNFFVLSVCANGVNSFSVV